VLGPDAVDLNAHALLFAGQLLQQIGPQGGLALQFAELLGGAQLGLAELAVAAFSLWISLRKSRSFDSCWWICFW